MSKAHDIHKNKPPEPFISPSNVALGGVAVLFCCAVSVGASYYFKESVENAVDSVFPPRDQIQESQMLQEQARNMHFHPSEDEVGIDSSAQADSPILEKQ